MVDVVFISFVVLGFIITITARFLSFQNNQLEKANDKILYKFLDVNSYKISDVFNGFYDEDDLTLINYLQPNYVQMEHHHNATFPFQLYGGYDD